MSTQPETMEDDYGHSVSEIRVLPSGGNANILCGRKGYEREMKFRRERNRVVAYPFDLPAWETLVIYWTAK